GARAGVVTGQRARQERPHQRDHQGDGRRAGQRVDPQRLARLLQGIRLAHRLVVVAEDRVPELLLALRGRGAGAADLTRRHERAVGVGGVAAQVRPRPPLLAATPARPIRTVLPARPIRVVRSTRPVIAAGTAWTLRPTRPPRPIPAAPTGTTRPIPAGTRPTGTGTARATSTGFASTGSAWATESTRARPAGSPGTGSAWAARATGAGGSVNTCSGMRTRAWTGVAFRPARVSAPHEIRQPGLPALRLTAILAGTAGPAVTVGSTASATPVPVGTVAVTAS